MGTLTMVRGLLWCGLLVLALAPGFCLGAAQADRAETIAADNRFGLKLFQDLAGAAGGKNVFFSPSSVAAALQMTMLGAAGTTREAMAKPFGLTENANLAPPANLSGPNLTLEVANAIWANQRIKIQPDYTATIKKIYGVDVRAANFGDPKTKDEINKWVAERTHDKIKNMIGKLSAKDALLLIDAIYFKGKWQSPFKKERTHEADFQLAAGGTKKVQMMEQAGKFEYKEAEGFGAKYQAIKLPYGDGSAEMLVVLPDKPGGLEPLIRGLDEKSWPQILDGMNKDQGTIGLPRFKVEYEKELNDPLKRLGMAEAFDASQADFSKMIAPPEKGFISEVLHKAFVEVNEEGTEAAAATSVRMSLTSAPARQPFRMIVDRPFLCVIRDAKTGEILFMGAIVDPQQ